jgi:hypothetical protein
MIVEEHQDIPSAHTGVPPHCPVKQSYDKSLHILHDSSSPTESSQTQEDHEVILIKHIQSLQKKIHNILQQAKKGSFISTERNLSRFRFKKIFPRDLTQWRPLLPKGRGLIQVEVSGHPPFLLAQNMGFHLGSVSIVFQVLNFWGHFEALNNVFLERLEKSNNKTGICFVENKYKPSMSNTIGNNEKVIQGKPRQVKENSNLHALDYNVIEDMKKIKSNISMFDIFSLPQQCELLHDAFKPHDTQI